MLLDEKFIIRGPREFRDRRAPRNDFEESLIWLA